MEVWWLFALGVLGICLVLPIATVLLLVKLRREHEAGLRNLTREFLAVRAEIRAIGGAAEGPFHRAPETKPESAATEPAPEQIKPEHIAPPPEPAVIMAEQVVEPSPRPDLRAPRQPAPRMPPPRSAAPRAPNKFETAAKETL